MMIDDGRSQQPRHDGASHDPRRFRDCAQAGAAGENVWGGKAQIMGAQQKFKCFETLSCFDFFECSNVCGGGDSVETRLRLDLTVYIIYSLMLIFGSLFTFIYSPILIFTDVSLFSVFSRRMLRTLRSSSFSFTLTLTFLIGFSRVNIFSPVALLSIDCTAASMF